MKKISAVSGIIFFVYFSLLHYSYQTQKSPKMRVSTRTPQKCRFKPKSNQTCDIPLRAHVSPECCGANDSGACAWICHEE